MNPKRTSLEIKGIDLQLSESLNRPVATGSNPSERPVKFLFSTATCILLTVTLMCCYLLIPTQSLAFGLTDIGKAFKEVAKSVQQHLTNKNNEKVNEVGKRGGKAVDQTVNQNQNASTTISSQQRVTILKVQQQLHTLGYDVGTLDGILGPRSVRAIKAFQHDHSLPETGQVSTELLVALRSANRQQASVTPSSGRAQPISIAGQSVNVGSWEVVKLPNGLDSTQLKVNDTVSAFLPARATASSKSGPAVILRVVHLNGRVSSGGFADVEIRMESIDQDGKRLATPNTFMRIVTDERDLVKTEGNADAKREVAAAREVDEIFGTGQKDAVRIPAGESLNFTIGKTESYISPQTRSNHPGRLSPWSAPKIGPQK